MSQSGSQAPVPEYENRKSPRNIYHGGEWDYFINGILLSMAHRNQNQYPLAQLNKDSSISFFIHQCHEANCSQCEKTQPFKEAFHQAFIIDQLDAHRKRLQLPFTANQHELLTKVPYNDVTNLVEYRFNISPEAFDTLLKLAPGYAYRHENSVLKLNKNFKLKPGKIRLFPVQPLDEKSCVVRAVGCQKCEMPAVQLLHLLPDYKHTERFFHWVPDQVTNDLDLNRGDILEMMNSLLVEAKMLDAKDSMRLKSDHDIVLSVPHSASSSISIEAMDKDSKEFYVLYGNTDASELDHCQSFEVTTVAFLNKARAIIKNRDEKSKDDTTLSELERDSLKYSLIALDKMIETEQKNVPPINPIKKFFELAEILVGNEAPPDQLTSQLIAEIKQQGNLSRTYEMWNLNKEILSIKFDTYEETLVAKRKIRDLLGRPDEKSANYNEHNSAVIAVQKEIDILEKITRLNHEVAKWMNESSKAVQFYLNEFQKPSASAPPLHAASRDILFRPSVKDKEQEHPNPKRFSPNAK